MYHFDWPLVGGLIHRASSLPSHCWRWREPPISAPIYRDEPWTSCSASWAASTPPRGRLDAASRGRPRLEDGRWAIKHRPRFDGECIAGAASPRPNGAAEVCYWSLWASQQSGSGRGWVAGNDAATRREWWYRTGRNRGRRGGGGGESRGGGSAVGRLCGNMGGKRWRDGYRMPAGDVVMLRVRWRQDVSCLYLSAVDQTRCCQSLLYVGAVFCGHVLRYYKNSLHTVSMHVIFGILLICYAKASVRTGCLAFLHMTNACFRTPGQATHRLHGSVPQCEDCPYGEAGGPDPCPTAGRATRKRRRPHLPRQSLRVYRRWVYRLHDCLLEYIVWSVYLLGTVIIAHYNHHPSSL